MISLTSPQQTRTKRPLDSAQSRLALLSYLTEKKESSSLFKRKTLYWDQEHLYSENMTLRNQVKELTEANTKAKTRILEMEDKLRSSEMKNYEQGYSESVLRSMSLKNLGRRSLILLRTNKPEEEENKTKSMRQIVRELRDEIATLKNQNSSLKRSLKYTRMNELQALNTEMEIELQRLNSLALQTKSKYYSLTLEFQTVKNNFRRENDAKKMAVQQKSKLQSEIFRLQRERQQYVKKAEMHEKQLRQEIKKVKPINPEIGYMHPKPVSHELNSIPKLEYSISGIDRIEGDTINFDRLINTESDLKSIPKITSVTSLELLHKQVSTKNDPTPKREVGKENEKVSRKASERIQTENYIQNVQEESERIGPQQQQYEEEYQEDYEIQEEPKQPKEKIKKPIKDDSFADFEDKSEKKAKAAIKDDSFADFEDKSEKKAKAAIKDDSFADFEDNGEMEIVEESKAEPIKEKTIEIVKDKKVEAVKSKTIEHVSEEEKIEEQNEFQLEDHAISQSGKAIKIDEKNEFSKNQEKRSIKKLSKSEAQLIENEEELNEPEEVQYENVQQISEPKNENEIKQPEKHHEVNEPEEMPFEDMEQPNELKKEEEVIAPKNEKVIESEKEEAIEPEIIEEGEKPEKMMGAAELDEPEEVVDAETKVQAIEPETEKNDANAQNLEEEEEFKQTEKHHEVEQPKNVEEIKVDEDQLPEMLNLQSTKEPQRIQKVETQKPPQHSIPEKQLEEEKKESGYEDLLEQQAEVAEGEAGEQEVKEEAVKEEAVKEVSENGIDEDFDFA